MPSNKSAQDYFHEAGIFLMQGNLQQATQCLRGGLKLDPSHQQAWMNLGVALKDLGNNAEAEQCLLQASTLDPNDGNTWFNLGSLYLRELGQFETAVRCFKEAIRCNPDDEDAVSFSAEALVNSGRWGDAMELLEQAIKAHPNWKSVLETRQRLAGAFRHYLENIAEGRPPSC